MQVLHRTICSNPDLPSSFLIFSGLHLSFPKVPHRQLCGLAASHGRRFFLSLVRIVIPRTPRLLGRAETPA